MDEADKIPLAAEIRDPQVFRADGIEATLTPRTITRADIFVLQAIKDNTGRAVYFSRTSGGYGQELGLGPYLITQGLARKLLRAMPTPGKDTMLVQGEGFVDLPRTTDLWTKVFVAPKSIAKKDKWIDKASVGIPALYVSTGFMLSDALRQSGKPDLARQVMGTAEQVARATRLSDLFAAAAAQQELPAAPGDTTRAVPLPVPPRDSTAKRDSGKK
jgi:hypothetical protein